MECVDAIRRKEKGNTLESTDQKGRIALLEGMWRATMSNRRSTIPLIHEGGVLCFNQLNNFAYLLSETFFPNQTAKGKEKSNGRSMIRKGVVDRTALYTGTTTKKKTNPNNQTMNIKNGQRSTEQPCNTVISPSSTILLSPTQPPRTCRPLSSPRPPEVDSGRFTSKTMPSCSHHLGKTSPFSQSVRLAIRPCAVMNRKAETKPTYPQRGSELLA